MSARSRSHTILFLIQVSFVFYIPSVCLGRSSYIIDTFDDAGQKNYTGGISNSLGYLNVSNVEQQDRIGKTVLLFQYDVVHSEPWGGYVNLQIDHERTNYIDCGGADTISFDFFNAVKQSSEGRALVRLTLLDKAGPSYEAYYSFHYILSDEPGWQTVSLPLQGDNDPSSPFFRAGWSGVEDNNVLDNNRIIGYIFEVVLNTDGDIGSHSEGSFYLDRLECSGSNLFGSGLTDPMWNYTIVTGSDWSIEETELILHPNGRSGRTTPVLEWNYFVEQTDVWGGTSRIQHYPGNGMRYSLKDSTHITFWYNNLVAQANPERAHLRFIVSDSSHCTHECWRRWNNEVYFSFFLVLDNAPGWHEASIELRGNSDSQSPMWRTGWVGITGNDTFDVDYVQGFEFDMSINSQGSIGTRTNGTILLSGLRAISNDTTSPENGGDASTCNSIPGLHLLNSFKFIEFAVATCCDKCRAEPECLYFQTNQRDCFLFSHLGSQDVELSTFLHTRLEAHWINDVSKVGLACTGEQPLCDCDTWVGVIDCGSRSLRTVPIFEHPYIDQVTTLDMSNNPDLTVIFDGHLTALADLTTLFLRGSPVTFMSPTALPPKVTHVEMNVKGSLTFSTSQPGAMFGNVCCNRRALEVTNAMAHNLYTCDKVADDEICSDCVFEEGVTYHDESLPLAIVKPESMLGYGASTPTTCGDLCSRYKGCLYFTWDGRDTLVAPVCYLKTNNLGALHVSDRTFRFGYDYFAYVSGYVALTRGNFRGVEVVLNDSSIIEMDLPGPENNFTTHYFLSLTSSPKRGAVWIRPLVRMNGNREAKFTIFPETVVVNVDDWSDAHRVTITLDPMGETGAVQIVVSHEVESCDEAFMSDSQQQTKLEFELNVLFNVPVENKNTSQTTKLFCWMLCAINVTISSVFFAWVVYYRAHKVVKFSQRSFLAIISIGGAASSLTILPLTYTDEEDWDGLARTGSFVPANNACMATVWMYSMGFVLTFTPLFVKSWRIHLMVSQSDRMRARKVSNVQLFAIMTGLILVDACIIVAWTIGAPLKFFRVSEVEDEVGNPLSSVGLCYSEQDSTAYIVLLVLFHLVVLIYGNYICYSIKHLTDTGMSEGKYVQVALFSNLQVLALALPVMVIVSGSPMSSMFVRSSVIFLNDACTMILIFVPKVLAVAGKIKFDTFANSQSRQSETKKILAASAISSKGVAEHRARPSAGRHKKSGKVQPRQLANSNAPTQIAVSSVAMSSLAPNKSAVDTEIAPESVVESDVVPTTWRRLPPLCTAPTEIEAESKSDV